MKTMKYILAALTVGGMMASCNTDIESLTIQRPLTYDDQYYQNLRDYKASEHEIAFGWFAQYGAQNSAAVRFMGLPDSLDICSMWGGIPGNRKYGDLGRNPLRAESERNQDALCGDHPYRCGNR